MAVYGPRSPTVADLDGFPTWVNGGNAYATDGAYASCTVAGQAIGTLYLHSYGFSIGAETLTGIKISARMRASTSGISTRFAIIGDGGEFGGFAVWSSTYLQELATVDTTYNFGGPGDTIGYIGAIADINTIFGVAIYGDVTLFTGTVFCDSALITVYTNGSTDPSGGGCLFRRRRSFRGG